MRKLIPIILLLTFFAATAWAGHVQVVGQEIDWLSSSPNNSNYCWHAKIQSCTDCPKKVDLAIHLYDEDGHIVDTVNKTIYLHDRCQYEYEGTAAVNCEACRIKKVSAVITHVTNLSR